MHATPKSWPETRLAYAVRTGAATGLQPLGPGHYLAEAMMRLGPVKSNGMDLRGADWPEIDAFARVTGRISDPWEAETLFDMCRAYLLGSRDGEDPLAIPPVDRGEAPDLGD
ncbi:hypothetical protein [Paracoccus benzoatiresistens]|uniref:Uncharacterized protein n=1 Tax=Paracoccus benzoatiresistens TaxID=2997341 RepID=A0ABT4J9T2_9RHOB|nr:hypothetical protein [Paracoccus sp. EF6]MCZ0963891.1 hypothetical protein [Paracoccus sp. EF6]